MPLPEKVSAARRRVHTGKQCLSGGVKLSSAFSRWASLQTGATVLSLNTTESLEDLCNLLNMEMKSDISHSKYKIRMGT